MPDDHVLQPHNSVMGLKVTPRSAMQDAFAAAKEKQQTPETKLEPKEEEVKTDG